MGVPAALIEFDIAVSVGTILPGFLVVGYRWERTPWVRSGIDRLFGRTDREESYRWLDWRFLTAIVAVYLAGVAFLQGQLQPCHVGVDDTRALLASGRAFWAGGSPFLVTECGNPVQVPYGMAGVLVDALGSLGGSVGIWLAWEAVAVTIVPLTWFAAGEDRRYITIYVATSVLYLPLVTSQIDGADNAIVPVAILAPLLLTSRRWSGAGVINGILSTAKFPSLFPFWGATSNGGYRRFVAVALSVTSFAVGTSIAYLLAPADFLRVVFLSQASRLGFSLNEFGILIPQHWLPLPVLVTVVQGVAILGSIVFVQSRRFPPARSVAIVLLVVAVSAQFLSYNFLLWLLPLALVGGAAQRGLWWIGAVGTFDYGLGLNVLAWGYGIYWPSEILAAALTGVLVWTAVGIAREKSEAPSERASRPEGDPTAAAPRGA